MKLQKMVLFVYEISWQGDKAIAQFVYVPLLGHKATSVCFTKGFSHSEIFNWLLFLFYFCCIHTFNNDICLYVCTLLIFEVNNPGLRIWYILIYDLLALLITHISISLSQRRELKPTKNQDTPSLTQLQFNECFNWNI